MADGMSFEAGGGYEIKSHEGQLLMSIARTLAEGAGLHALGSSVMILAWCHEHHPESHSLDLKLTILRKWIMLEKSFEGSPASPTEIAELMDRVKRGGEVLARMQKGEERPRE